MRCVGGPDLYMHTVQQTPYLMLQVQQGLLWIWPESGADAWLEASATSLDTVPEMVDPSYAGSQGGFAFMENPASLAIMLVRQSSICQKVWSLMYWLQKG